MIFAKNYDSQILDALKKVNPEMAENLFKNTHFERIPNDRRDGKNGYTVYAAQCGDVTCTALQRHDGTWMVQVTCW